MESKGDRLRRKREERGFTSARSAALRFGWVVSTYTSHENGIREFGADDAEKYARALGTTPAYLLYGDREKISSSLQVNAVPVLGEVAVGVWREMDVDIMSQPAVKLLDMPMLKEPQTAGRRFAVRVGDASVNMQLQQGDYAVCQQTRRQFDPDAAAIGDLLLVERMRRGLKEISIRRVAESKDGRLRLTSHSTDARMTGSFFYPSPQTCDKVTVLAKVVGKYADL